jgi:lysophospholipase L1-like esterase
MESSCGERRGGRFVAEPFGEVQSGIVTFNRLITEGLKPDAIIVALGTNDVSVGLDTTESKQLIRRLLDLIGPIPIAWVNISDSKVFNTALQQLTAEYPNLIIGDWYGRAVIHPEWFEFDEIHPTPDGYIARAELYRQLAAQLKGLLDD